MREDRTLTGTRLELKLFPQCSPAGPVQLWMQVRFLPGNSPLVELLNTFSTTILPDDREDRRHSILAGLLFPVGLQPSDPSPGSAPEQN